MFSLTESTEEITLEETNPTEYFYGQKIKVRKIELYLDENLLNTLKILIDDVKLLDKTSKIKDWLSNYKEEELHESK